ncbi:MAG TPA: hypothetical protein VHL11_14605, partial [Phototrophicaceae bacterium]|nr:hypothetical protein [Phototrophicaceae bacterium]
TYEAIEPILASFLPLNVVVPPTATETPTPETSAPETDQSTGGSEVEPTATIEPCFVSAEEAKTARLRVGPGENRSAIAFLPPNKDFTVTGRFVVEDDESVWFKLDKTEVDPNSSAAELWVAEKEVTEQGSCDSVGDASAPPIVPIIPGNGGGNTGSGDSSGTSEPGTLPQSGTWTLTLDATTYASCTGSETVSFPTTDFIVGGLTRSVSVSVTNGGSTIIFDGDALAMTAPGNYVGSFDMGGGDNFQTYLTINSATSMSGRLVGNTIISGVGCSFTIYFGVSR